MSERVLIFDVDGVLVDVRDSYREIVRLTVEHFTGKQITNNLIQEYKNAGGWNNDWDLCAHLIKENGVNNASYEAIVEYFNRLFFGDGRDGLVMRERWIARNGLLEELSDTWDLAIFTGRLRVELNITLDRFARRLRFDPIMSADVLKKQKPDPEGLLRIAEANPGKALWYIGDSIDDARSSRAANIPFIGIAAPDNPRRSELAGLLKVESAVAVLDDINQLPLVLPQ